MSPEELGVVVGGINVAQAQCQYESDKAMIEDNIG